MERVIRVHQEKDVTSLAYQVEAALGELDNFRVRQDNWIAELKVAVAMAETSLNQAEASIAELDSLRAEQANEISDLESAIEELELRARTHLAPIADPVGGDTYYDEATDTLYIYNETLELWKGQ